MDFTSRNAQPAGSPSAGSLNKKVRRDSNGKWFRIAVAAVIAFVVVLIIGVILAISSANGKPESSYVDTGKLQAVFLNTGQVYFGNVKTLTSKFIVLTNIYYLQTNSNSSNSKTSSSNNNVSLVKLGCELHEPYDQMVINRDQVTFWENLQSTGQVAKAVAAFQQQNPDGQKCAEQSSSASTTSGSAAQNAGSSSAPSTSTSTKSGQ